MGRTRNAKPPVIVTLDPGQALAGEGQASRLRTLFDLARRVLEPAEPAQVFTAIHETLTEHLEPERAALMRLSRDGSIVPLTATRLDLSGPMEKWAISHGVVRKVRDTGLAVLATEVSHENEGQGVRVTLRSVLSAPLSRVLPVRGLLYLDSREGHGRTFHRDDLDFVAALSMIAAAALDRAYGQQRTAAALRKAEARVVELEQEVRRREPR